MNRTTNAAANDNYNVDITQLRFGRELDGCRCLNLCEVRLILNDQLRSSSRQNPQAQEVIQKSYDYSAHFAKVKVRQAVLDLRSVLDKHGDLHEFEIASLVNLFPRTPDEAKCLTPSLARLKDPRLNQILEELESYRIFDH